jgi:hypothetical protein
MNAELQINVPREPGAEPAWLELVRTQVGSLRYGVVQIIVHDAQVIQIEKTERVRLDKPGRVNRAARNSETDKRFDTTKRPHHQDNTTQINH